MPAAPQENMNRRGSTLTGMPGIAPIIALPPALVAVLLLIAPSAAERPTVELDTTYQVTLTVGGAVYISTCPGQQHQPAHRNQCHRRAAAFSHFRIDPLQPYRAAPDGLCCAARRTGRLLQCNL